MDSFEINKIIGAILLIALLTIGIGKISNMVFFVEKPINPGYKVEVLEKKDVKNITSENSEIEEIDI